MSSPSNGQRKKMNHRLWKKIRQAGGSNVEIENDPLGARYQVNKFGIIVTADTDDLLQEAYNRLLVMLKVECWTFEQSGSTLYVSYPPLAPVVAAISPPSHGSLRIGVH